MPSTATLAVAVAGFTLSACSVGLDPRRLELLHYGMPQRDIEPLLASSEGAIPVMCFFVDDGDGRVRPVRIDFYEGMVPHPHYALVSVDGALVASTLAGNPDWELEGQWWRTRDAGPDARIEEVWWTPAALRELRDEALSRRMPLAWPELEPIDSLHHRRHSWRGQMVATMVTFVWPVVLLPYYAARHVFGGASLEHADAMRAFLLDASPETTVEQVVAVLGPPSDDRAGDVRGDAARVLRWDLSGPFTITVGFRDGRLLWADFGSWFAWAEAFIR